MMRPDAKVEKVYLYQRSWISDSSKTLGSYVITAARANLAAPKRTPLRSEMRRTSRPSWEAKNDRHSYDPLSTILGCGVFQGSCRVNRLTMLLFSQRFALDPG
ncbi:hypothetical protein, partial [Pseudomonas syringae]|uniref:hypothetical protein n=1 Tax=Pseudomonas syringae TaxID=317 RepID=UPI001E2D7A27